MYESFWGFFLLPFLVFKNKKMEASLEKGGKMVDDDFVSGEPFSIQQFRWREEQQGKEKFLPSECRHIWRAGGGADAGMLEVSS